MLHLIAGLIGSILLIAIFGEFIIGIALLIAAVLLASLIGWLIGLYSVQFTIVGLVIILLATVFLLFDKSRSLRMRFRNSITPKQDQSIEGKVGRTHPLQFKNIHQSHQLMNSDLSIRL